MKIAIDISSVIYGTGVSVYTKNLVRSLLKIDKDNKYILFGGSFRRKAELKNFTKDLEGNFETRFFNLPPLALDVLWNRLGFLSIERLVGNIDVYHSSDWSQAPSKAFKVTTVHDLAPILLPQQTHPKIVAVHKRKLARSIKYCNATIVPSKSTKKDLVDLGADAKKIHVIYEAIDPDFKKTSKSEVERVKKKYRLSDSYALSVGASRRKNISKAVAAFEKAATETGLKEYVITGSGYMPEGRGIRALGYVDLTDLSALYTGAKVFLYPSLYEGFGLPILESFICETPVVTSNTSSMPEVAGDAAILVNPEDEENIADGIIKAIKNNDSLVKKGLKQVNKFSWQEAVKQTLAVYNKAT